ncbi:MAG: DUF4855 domain-containing protein [Alicyclobacillus sp.]|nr:DUF4855 domain-containing protein [Alicyclobacillus sp.]
MVKLKRRVLALSASLLVFSAPVWMTPAYADASSPGTFDPASEEHAWFPDQTPGTDISDPASYPFLPPGQQAPHPGPRSHSPRAVGTDLALGLPYTISAQFPDANWQKDEAAFPDRGQLTDGKFASLDFTDPQWVGLEYQYRHDITINLGKVENIHAISLDFLQNLGAGIVFPDSVTYYVSQDGQHWAVVGQVASQYGAGDYTVQTQPFELDGLNVNAQYVRAEFTNKIWGFIDQFSVYGYPAPNPAAKTPVGSPPADQPVGYLTASNPASGGIRNLLLVYTGAHGDLGTWTPQKFAPMVTYEDGAGVPQRWLFDGVLFTNYGMSPSAANWSNWLDNLFSPDIQLSALDQAVGAAKAELKDPDYKEKVVIAIPGTNDTTTDFGSIVPGEATLDFNPNDVPAQVAYENRVRAVEWFIEQALSRWQNAHFQNLELAGFYWQPESLGVTDPYSAQLVQAAADAIHRRNLLFYWIPFDGAVGVTDWRQLGFDAVMIQPNVSFHWSYDPMARFASVTQMAQVYGTGLEMEAHWWVTSPNTSLAQTAQNKYFDYFSAGNLFGYQGDVVKSYYQSSNTFLLAFQSTNPFYHQVYDNTARFIFGQWTDTSLR